MEQTVSFPALGLEFEIDRVAFHLPDFLGGMPIYWYGVLIGLGLLLAVFYVLKRADKFGLDSDRAFDVTFIAILLGVIGARLYYVAFSWEEFSGNLISIFNTRTGGLAIYGGIILGAIGVVVGCKLRKVKLLPMMDLIVGAVLIGQAVGRWGNFFNVEVFGTNTTLPWGMTGEAVQSYLQSNQQSLMEIGMIVNPAQPVHPTFLYESLWCVIGFFLIVHFTKKRRFDGQLALFYFAWYGFGRFFIEGIRTDSLMIGSFRVSQLLSLVCFIISSIILLAILNKIKKHDDPEYLKLYVNTEEAELIRKGEFYKKKTTEKTTIQDDTSKTDLSELNESEKTSDELSDNKDTKQIDESTKIPEESLADEEIDNSDAQKTIVSTDENNDNSEI